jgi:hypothetical protein
MSTDLLPPPAEPGYLGLARAKLGEPRRPDLHWAALAAAAFFALCAIGFAAAAVLAPPLEFTPAARAGVR